jgi:hypothetical protein
MRTERSTEFAGLEGTLLRYGIPSGSDAWESFKSLETNRGNMSSEQIFLIRTLIERVIVARDQVTKEAIKKAIDDLEKW